VDAARASLDFDRARADASIAAAGLMLLLGRPADQPSLALATSNAPSPACASVPDLVREALVARPDVRAAEIGVEAAASRLGWERSRILALTAVLDANGRGTEGFEMGPGIDLRLPILNRNQGGHARRRHAFMAGRGGADAEPKHRRPPGPAVHDRRFRRGGARICTETAQFHMNGLARIGYPARCTRADDRRGPASR
jgi:hypothetical protein